MSTTSRARRGCEHRSRRSCSDLHDCRAVDVHDLDHSAVATRRHGRSTLDGGLLVLSGRACKGLRGLITAHSVLTATGQWSRGARFGPPESCRPLWRSARRSALNRLCGEQSRPVQHPDESDRAVVGLCHREVDMSRGRLGTFVEVSVQVDRAHRYPAQQVVAQGQRRVGGAQRQRGLRRKTPPRATRRGSGPGCCALPTR